MISTNAMYCNERSSTIKVRLVDNKKPQFTCVNSVNKDGYGLITADEVAFAGGMYEGREIDAYFKTILYNTDFRATWTMSGYGFENKTAFMFTITNSIPHMGIDGGSLSKSNTDYNAIIRPVISLKPNVLISGGNGTASSPYIIEAG